MTVRFFLALTFMLSLGACGAPDDSPLEREQIVKLSPGDTYEVLQGATHIVAATHADDALKMVPSSDGYQEIRISYVWQGREIVTQKFNITAGPAPGETKLRLTLSAASTATEEDRRKFARIKGEQSRRFDQFGKMLNSSAMAELVYGGASGMTDLPARTAALSGQAPVAQNPVPSAEASAPEMSAAPTLDPTASIR